MSRGQFFAGFAWLVLLTGGAHPAFSLDPHKAITQYTRTSWTQANGLPQDTVRSIAQTPDGYLWLGTSEGLARFDGYEFVSFNKEGGHIPGNSVVSLTAGHDGTLWIGTSDGIASYKDGTFVQYKGSDGFPTKPVTSLVEDRTGTLWIVSGGALSSFKDRQLHTYPAPALKPLASARIAYEDKLGGLWIAGVSGVVKRAGDGFAEVLGPAQLGDAVITTMLHNAQGLWLAGNDKGITHARKDGSITRYTTRDGLPHNLVLELLEDRSGNVWAGTYGGLGRFENGRFASAPPIDKRDRDWVWALLEGREGDLWVGTSNSLVRMRDDQFTMFGRTEGLPSDEPMAVHQDARGQIWIAFRDAGLVAFDGKGTRQYSTRDGLPSDEIYTVRSARNGDLLISTMRGLSRMSSGRFVNYTVPDPAGRPTVMDVMEDSQGQIWAATPSGAYRLAGGSWIPAIESTSDPSSYTVVLAEGPDRSMWAGTFLGGLWRLRDPSAPSEKPRLFTAADGPGSNQIRSIMWDSEQTMWLGTFGGGITGLWDGKWHRFGAQDGLLSDNVSHIEDDGKGDLWLSTTKGICRISKQQLRDFAAGRITRLTPQNYGTADGLRSAQSAPAFPSGGGGTRTADGRLWFTTGNGVATIDPASGPPDRLTQGGPPRARLVGVAAGGRNLDLSSAGLLEPGTDRVEFRYVGVYLSAPEKVRYSYRLQGLEKDWIPAEGRRLVSYSRLPHGRYTFLVRAEHSGGSSEAGYEFQVLPHFYETRTFLALSILGLMGLIYGAHRLRMAQIHSRFTAVFQERARLAREIHDTLAQGFVGISHQLDVLATKLDEDPGVRRQQLDLARRMTRHSLTEARRSMMDLRMTELEGHALPTALAGAARRWVAGTGASLRLNVTGSERDLPPDLEQNLFRIAQEAISNAVKHSRASSISVDLLREEQHICLRVSDDGTGFETNGLYSQTDGHFGIIGMRERAERFGGTFALASSGSGGTTVEVRVPLAGTNTKSH